MPREVKVYGGLTFAESGKQVRTIVATDTKKKACELLNMSIGEFNTYWSQTGNKAELEAGRTTPNKVLCATKQFSKDFSPRKDNQLNEM